MKSPLLAVVFSVSLCAVALPRPAFAGDRDHDRDHEHDWRPVHGDRDRDDFDGPPVAVARGAFLRDLNEMLQDANEIAEHSDDAWGKRDRREVREHLTDLQNRLQALRDELEDAPVVRPGTLPPPPPPLPPAGPVAMTPDRFNAVLGSIRDARFTSGKFVVLQDVERENYFTVDQVIAVMNEMYWTDDKVKSAALLYPHVIDRGDWFRVYGTLTFDSDKEKLRSLCGG